MSASLKIRQLESKISDLQKQHDLLLKERQQEIAVLLSAIDLAHLDDKILMGSLLFIKEKITTQDPILEAWRDAGEKFLRRTKPKTWFHRHEHAGGKQENACSRIPDKKVSPKQATAPQTVHQLPQNHLAREKNKMQQQHQSERKARTRQVIAAGGLLHKSGIMEVLSIAPRDDLQDFENFEKAAQLLGFLTICFEENDFNESNLEEWKSVGERLLRGA